MFYNLTPMVRNLLIINVALFALIHLFGFYGLYDLLILFPFNSEAFRPFQLFTHIFMHGSLSHLFFNMIGLFFFGPMLEQFWGSNRFVLFYIVCGIGAAGLYAIISYSQGVLVPMLGASGAIYGVLMGVGMLFPNTELRLLFPPIPIKAKYLAMGLGAIAFYSALNSPGDGVAHLAHLAGMLFAFILIKIWQK